MTARAETPVYVDAAQVHAEGVLSGLKTALNLLARTNGATVPVALRRLVREWECNAIHYEWRAQQGRPVTVQRDAQVRAFIAIALERSGLSVLPDES